MTGNEFGKKSYAYAVGCIKASSHPPLTPERLARLENADKEDFPKLLDEFGWGKGIEGSVSERIEGEFDYAVAFVKDISPDKALTDLLFFETDAVNLKLFAKARLSGRDVTDLADRGGSIPIDIIRGSVEAWDFTLISDTVNGEMKDYENERDPFVLSSVCDRAIFLHTLEKAKKKSASLYRMLLRYGEEKNKIAEARLARLGNSMDGIKKLLLPVSYVSPDTEKNTPDDIVAAALKGIETAMGDMKVGENFAPIADYFFSKKNEASELRRIWIEKGGER